MNKDFILSKVDHTLLRTSSTFSEIKTICDDAIQYKTASICIPPYYVKQAFDYVENKVPICTVIGFPNGNNTTKTKCFETENAIKNGASEIDMVINLGMFNDGDYCGVENEIQEIKKICSNHILKVIVETCLWDEKQKIELCKIVSNSGADFIKTSTGFSTGGATREDIQLFAKYVDKNVKIKAAGGIKSWQDAEDFITLGASRLGTSSLVKLMKNEIK